jgi:hypothetical protein
MSNPNAFIDVHVFDGKCVIPRVRAYTRQSWYDAIQYYKRLMKRPESIQLLDKMLRDPDHANVDRTDRHIHAINLLCEYIHLTKNVDFVRLLDEQLSDCYTLGQCPQGRVKRILQCVLAFSQ